MPTYLRTVALVSALVLAAVVVSGAFIAQAKPTPSVQAIGVTAVTIPTVESDHPYKNSTDKFWTIANTGGQSAARIHFSRIDLEPGVDKIEIRDAEDTLIQEITTSSPDGLWSDTVPGASIKVALKTDGSGQYWGFGIDQLDPVAYTTLGYSPHPYLNGSTAVKTLMNNTANPAGTRVHFDRVELEDGVDYIVIKDLNDTPYQWITGSYPNGFTSKAVPGSAIKVQLVTDSADRAWGYNIAAVETASPDVADVAPLRTTLAESNHPYASDYNNTWFITNPDASAVSSKVHFSQLTTEYGYDILQVLDANDTVIQTLTGQQTDFWSDYVPGRIIKLRLISNGCCSVGWGFRADAIVNSVANPGLAQSNHSYASDFNQVWTITNPNVDAVSSKVHFSQVNTEHGYDILQVLDANDTVVQTLTGQQTDFWSDYVPGRVVKLRLITNGCCSVGWGFRANTIINSVVNPGLAQSNHPYASDFSQVWTITNPNVSATSSRIHFALISTEQGYDILQVLDANDTVVQTLTGQQTDFWSDYVPGRIVKLKLITNGCCRVDWGFRADAIEPSSAQNPAPAGLNALLVQVNAPGDVFLNGTKLFSVSYAGEYRVPLTSGAGIALAKLADTELSAAAAGAYTIRIDYVTGYSQTIQATIGADGGIKVVYLPLVKK